MWFYWDFKQKQFCLYIGRLNSNMQSFICLNTHELLLSHLKVEKFNVNLYKYWLMKKNILKSIFLFNMNQLFRGPKRQLLTSKLERLKHWKNLKQYILNLNSLNVSPLKLPFTPIYWQQIVNVIVCQINRFHSVFLHSSTQFVTYQETKKKEIEVVNFRSATAEVKIDLLD